MRRLTILFFLILGLTLAAYAGAELLSFRVFPVVDHSQLEWSTGAEDGLRLFIVERSSDGSNYFSIGQVAGKGSYSQYHFSDSSPLDAIQEDRTFYYRLKIVDRDGTFRYSEVKEASLSFSDFQQTWGSIKAMFR
jgi:hypothetical protein